MYQKTAAKNGRHEPADVTSNIAALSQIVLQVFEHSGHGNHFRSIPEATAPLQVDQHPAPANKHSYPVEHLTIKSQQQRI